MSLRGCVGAAVLAVFTACGGTGAPVSPQDADAAAQAAELPGQDAVMEVEFSDATAELGPVDGSGAGADADDTQDASWTGDVASDLADGVSLDAAGDDAVGGTDAVADADLPDPGTAACVATLAVDPAEPPSLACPFFTATLACADASLTALLTLTDGGLAAAGRLGWNAWLIRLDPTGKLLWQKTYPLTPWTNLEPATAMASAPGGGFLLVGSDNYDNQHAWMLRTDSAGATLWIQQWTPMVSSDLNPSPGTPMLVAVAPSGGFYVAGQGFTAAKGGAMPWLMHIDDQGVPLASHVYLDTPIQNTSNARGLGVQPDGGVLLSTFGKVGAGTAGTFVLRIDPAGEQTGLDVDGDALATFADGSSVGAHIVCGKATLVRRDTKDKVLWTRDYLWSAASCMPNPSSILALATLPGQEVVAAIRLDTSSPNLLVRFDSSGLIRWQQPINSSVSAIRAHGNGFAFLSGPDGAQTTIVTVDGWANNSCGISGNCGSQAPQDCDDANPCTSDLCQKGGCQHIALPDNLPCSQGGTCKAGVCL